MVIGNVLWIDSDKCCSSVVLNLSRAVTNNQFRVIGKTLSGQCIIIAQLHAAEGSASVRTKQEKCFHNHFSVIRMGSRGTYVLLHCKFQMYEDCRAWWERD